MFGAPEGQTKITTSSIPGWEFGPFRDRATAVLYANAEFGPGKYSLIG